MKAMIFGRVCVLYKTGRRRFLFLKNVFGKFFGDLNIDFWVYGVGGSNYVFKLVSLT